MKKIKILVDGHIFDHSFQGTATYMYGLYSALVRHDNLEISFCAHDVPKIQLLFPDLRFKFIKLKSVSRIRRLAIEYPKIIKDGGFDYAHFQYVVPFIKNCKFINTIHDLLFLEFKQYFPWSYRISRSMLFYLSAKRSDLILTVSNYSKCDISERFNISKDLIYVTPNAVVKSPISEIDIKRKYGLKKIILFVSRFEPRKNHISLLKAFLELNLHNKGYNLVFIGSKKESIEIQAFNDLNILLDEGSKSNVHFLEGISWDDLNAFYQQSECFVFPSLAEGFGIPPIEAAMNGCKVLCSNTTAMADFSFFKYHFDPNYQIQLTQGLEAILEDQNYPFNDIIDSISSNYSWDIIANNFKEIVVRDFNNK